MGTHLLGIPLAAACMQKHPIIGKKNDFSKP